jgi:hypothetical protein
VEILTNAEKAKKAAELAEKEAKALTDSLQNDRNSKIEKEKAAKIAAVANLGTPVATQDTTPTAASTNAASPSASSSTGPTSLLSDNLSSETQEKSVTAKISTPSLGIGATSVLAALSISSPSSIREKEAGGVSQEPPNLAGDLPAESLTFADQNSDKNKTGENAEGKKKKKKKKRSLEKSDSAVSSQAMFESSSDENSEMAGKVRSPDGHSSPSKRRQSETSH